MKKTLLILATVVLTATAAFSQAKKPTIMVVPSETWCVQNGFTQQFDNQGHMELVADYNKAFQQDPNLLLAISKINEMMSERGFPLKDLAATMRSLRTEAAEESVTTSSDGDDLAESPLDKLRRVAKADIIIDMTYTINALGGPRKSLTLNMRGLDAYTNKQIAAASGTSQPSFSVEMPVLIEESILSHIDNFNNQLQNFFDDIFENGREVSLVCRRWSGSDIDFETEFDGEELGFLIEEWIADNTVNGRFTTSDATENRMVFEQVRIPLFNERGRAVDTRNWANDLRRELTQKHGIDAKLSIRGLGEAIITVGGK